MNQLTLLSVGRNAFILACLALASCSSNDPAPATSSGGTPSNGGASTASGGASATTKTGKGGTSATTAEEGGSDQGGASQGGGDPGGADQGGTSSKSSAASSKGGTTSKSGSSGSNKGGSSAQSGDEGGTGGIEQSSSVGGTSSTSATSTAAVEPTKVSDSDYRFTLETCKVVMDVNPAIGARVAKLTLDGKAIIKPFTDTTYNREGTTNNAGSTFWTSPQSAWPVETWPPVKEIDGGTNTVNLDDKAHLVTTGPANTTLGISVIKDFSADDSTCWITMDITMKASKAASAAPWQITRVPRGGIAFFPVGDASKLVPGPLDQYTTTSGSPNVAWFDDTNKAATSGDGSKLVADGANGWLAYALGGNLFIKKFTDVEPASFATKEGDVEIYPGDGYLELEVQGAYKSIAANTTYPWTVQWKVVAIPSSVTVAKESETLLAFAEEQVGS